MSGSARTPRGWRVTANLYLSRTVAALLALALVWQVSRMAGDLMAAPPPDSPTQADDAGQADGAALADSAGQADGPAQTDGTVQADSDARMQAIIDSNLFGDREAQAVADASTAASVATAPPETPLNLRLAAIVAFSGNDGTGVAIIAHAGRQRIYTVAEEIDGARGVQLHAVFNDHVVLDRAGRLETLRLPENHQAVASLNLSGPGASMAFPLALGSGATTLPAPLHGATPLQGATPLPAASPLSGASPLPRAAAPRSDPSRPDGTRIAATLRIDPHLEQGRMTGFRLDTGADAALLESLGLRTGDLLTHLDGMALNDPGLDLHVHETLRRGAIVHLGVLRDGTPRILTVDTR